MNAEVTYSKEELEKMLSTGISKIVFTKLDGTVREMVCTRDTTVMPADMIPSTGKAPLNRVKSATTISVYDINEDGWRSFIVENLISIDRE